MPGRSAPASEDRARAKGHVVDRRSYDRHRRLGQRPHDPGDHAGQRSDFPSRRRHGRERQGGGTRCCTSRAPTSRTRFRPIARRRTGSTSRSARSIAARTCSSTRRCRSATRVGPGRLQRRGDRSADVAPGAQDLRRRADGDYRGRTAERGDPAGAGDARAARRAPSSRRWCCPASSFRPARRPRSSSATPRRCGCRDTSMTKTSRPCTSATRSTSGTRRSRRPFTASFPTSATSSIRRRGPRRSGSSRRTPTGCSRRTCSSTS